MLPVSVLASYPIPDVEKIDELLSEEILRDTTKLIVLDDDPTGVQSVHDVSVYTDWSAESLRAGFAEKNKLFYILTNSRGMTPAQTAQAHVEIAAAVSQAARESGVRYLIMSRSDSTLRGHYPLETALLRQYMEQDGFRIDGEIICPFFKNGGRFTIDNVHYVKEGDQLIPAAETEFAKDPTFGYAHSSIPEYVEEKTKGQYLAENVICISLADLRAMNIYSIQKQLEAVRDFNKVCVNAVDYCDVKVFAIALYRAMAAGKSYIFRTAADLVKTMGGIADVPLLTREEMITHHTANGGVVVVGSHTQKTTRQLEKLLAMEDVVSISFNSDLVLQGKAALESEVNRCVAIEEAAISAGKTAVCFTCRGLLSLPNDTPEEALLRSMQISEGVQMLIGKLKVSPAFIIAKGGITSSDIGTRALKVWRAKVLGQIRPGIPVWQTGPESKFPITPYVIFPGNVGDADTLKEAVEILQGHNRA